MLRPRLIADLGAAALLAAPLIGLLACGSSTPVSRDDAGPADRAAERATSATDAAASADASDAGLPNLGGFSCVDEPGDGGYPSQPDGGAEVAHRCEANQSYCLIQELPPAAGGGAIGHCELFDVPDAAAACGFHPVCGCASPSRLANCTCDQSYNSVTVRCGPV
jgi:hypothetical protein